MKKRIKAEEKSVPAIAVLPRPAEVDQGTVFEVKIAEITTDNRNDRLVSNATAIAELAESMASRGQLQPIVVGLRSDEQGETVTKYMLVAGHRRLAAAKLLKWTEIRAVVRTYASDHELQLDRATENIHREDLNAVERAYAVGSMIEAAMPAARQALVDEAIAGKALASDDVEDVRYLAKVRRRAIEMVALKVGKSVTWVTDHSYLSSLSGEARKLVLKELLPITYAREICKVADPDRRDELAVMYAAPDEPGGRPGDFDELRNAVADKIMSLAQVPWRLDVAFANAPACQSCPKNSANNTGLFEHFSPCQRGYHSPGPGYKEPEAGVCMDRTCFKEKAATTNRQIGAKGKSLAARITALPKADRPAAITAKTIADLGEKFKIQVPRYLDESDVARRVKEEMARRPSEEKPSAAATSKSSASGKPSADQLARNAHDQKLREWQREITRKINKVCQADPLRAAALQILDYVVGWEALGEEQARGTKPRKDALPPAIVQQLISFVAKPTLDGFKLAGERIALDAWNWPSPHCDAVERLAQALDIKVAPRPQLKLPAPKAPKKAAGKASKGKAHVEEDDD
ncbi:MAG: ParB/RepB/Spo0J family partition protein [Phycisphaerales bacterium]|nr:ParB/RepB/Spo0J family partition protein [Phycisphaerales bacterium]